MVGVSKVLEKIGGRLREDGEVLALLLFGSCARGEEYSDIDLCLVLRPGRYGELELSKKKVEYQALLGPPFDVQVFQQLPIYVRIRVLREGKVLFCRDEGTLYDLAFLTVKEFEHFRPHYRDYLEEIARG